MRPGVESAQTSPQGFLDFRPVAEHLEDARRRRQRRQELAAKGRARLTRFEPLIIDRGVALVGLLPPEPCLRILWRSIQISKGRLPGFEYGNQRGVQFLDGPLSRGVDESVRGVVIDVDGPTALGEGWRVTSCANYPV